MREKVNLKVSLDDGRDLYCDGCGETVFDLKYSVKVLSSLVSPAGMETVVLVPVLVCSKCGKVVMKGVEVSGSVVSL